MAAMEDGRACGSPTDGQVRVVIWGLGAMGRLMASMVMADPDLRLVASVSRRAAGSGKVDTADMVGLKRPTGAPVYGSLGEALQHSGGADVVLHGTSSFVREVSGEIEASLDHGLNVVTIAEEMAYPWAGEPEKAQALDELARARGRTVLGTGVNPGFVLDTLIAVLSSVTAHVESVYAGRVNDLSPFGPMVMRTQGVGLAPDEFARRAADGTVVVHIGFPESMHLIARALGIELTRVEQTREPIISGVRRETPHVVVEPGFVAGCRHTARGFAGDRVIIELDHPQQVRPEAEGVSTGDYIRLSGIPNIEVRTEPEIPGGLATAALAVNMVAPVAMAEPGLLTMLDLPVPRGSARRRAELIIDDR